MRVFVFSLSSFLFFACTSLNVNRTINNAETAAAAPSAAKLQATVNQAIRYFEQAFGPLAQEIRFDTSGASCMRVGYDYINKVVNFCETKQVINQGMDSVDVIRHEVFHAMLCQKNPALCEKEFLSLTDNQALHEALADFFAYTMAPDKSFGENFYFEKPAIRDYRTGFCYSLVKGYHEKGNVLVSKLIDSQATLSTVAQNLEKNGFSPLTLVDLEADSCFSKDEAPEFVLVPAQGSESNLNRYRMPLRKPLLLIPKFNEAFIKKFKNFSVKIEAPPSENFVITEMGRNQFSVEAVKEGPFLEAVMLIYNEGVLIGRAKYYFAVNSRPPAVKY